MSITTEAGIREALAAPAERATDLLRIFNDRGLRDAAVVITARSGDWQALKAAALDALSVSSAGRPETSPYGPLAVLGAAVWTDPDDDDDPDVLLRAVPESDPAHRMASLVLRLSCTGDRDLPRMWAARMVSMDIRDCISFGSAQRQPVG